MVPGLRRKKQMSTETWFAFRAYNSQAIYGFGTPEEADRYTNILNENREINVYSAHALTAAQAAELRLEDGDEGFNLADELAAR